MSNPLEYYFGSNKPAYQRVQWQGFALHLYQEAWGQLAIAEQGGQVLHFKPAGMPALLWLSSKPKPPGNAIRGGIPICWPWFGSHPHDAEQISHGPARIAQWRIVSAQTHANSGQWQLCPTAPLMDGVSLQLHIEINPGELRLDLRSHNLSSQAFVLSQALHSYFQISALNECEVKGLDTCHSYNKLSDSFLAPEPIQLSGEIDRVFEHQNGVQLRDKKNGRVLEISKNNSSSTVVWNPGADNLASDIDLKEQNAFICIEAANTASYDPITLKPGQEHCLQQIIKF